jgi:hypothetical protein
MVRAGFQIRFLDDVESKAKHCEFVASCTTSGVRLAIEAKSRVRPGVLHNRGEFQYEGDHRGLLRLLRDACRQSVEGLPLVIFIDVNVPPTPQTPPAEKLWVRDIGAAADDIERRADEKGEGDPFALIVATNFAFHFGDHQGLQAPVEFGVLPGRRPAVPIPDTTIVDRITWGVAHYARIPAEI